MRVLIVEPHSYHTSFLGMYRELLPSLLGTRELQMDFLVRRRTLHTARAAVGPDDQVSPIGRYLDSSPHGAAGRLLWPRQVLAHLRRNRPDVIVLNTLSEPESFALLRRARVGLKIGLLHNPGVVPEGWRPRTDERLACLHGFNFEGICNDTPVSVYFEPFACPAPGARVEPEEALRVAAAGVISFDRRDYGLLLDVARELRDAAGPSPAHFEVLGDPSQRDGPELRRRVHQAGLDPAFSFFERLADADFFGRLGSSDYVAALVRPQAGPYGRGKISLAYGNSGALGRPLLIHSDVAARMKLPADGAALYRTPRDVADVLTAGRAVADEKASRYVDWVAHAIEANKAFLESHRVSV